MAGDRVMKLGKNQTLSLTEDLTLDRLTMHPSSRIERNGFTLTVRFVDVLAPVLPRRTHSPGERWKDYQ